ncbi:uncharacterized protein LOC126895555 [Daktulosphaira vitifoliae]|uniref:uncharacterized protein LOC126895555 n=1 Tax=Daktulosphaira vitifoliae TaxID=58002 RepID=UPI0021AAC80E|nr:uncharacterized protein LOC126895555 [Daktulosphaira vitifoliae]
MNVKRFFRLLARVFTCSFSKKERNINEGMECYLNKVSNHEMKSDTMQNEYLKTKITAELEDVTKEKVDIEDNKPKNILKGCDKLEENVHELNMTEPKIIVIERAAFVETCSLKEGIICFIEKKKKFCYPQKVKFVVDDSEPKLAYEVAIIGDPYIQR